MAPLDTWGLTLDLELGEKIIIIFMIIIIIIIIMMITWRRRASEATLPQLGRWRGRTRSFRHLQY